MPIRAPRCLGIGRDRHHRLGGGPEQQVVDDRLVLPGDVGDLGRQREDDVEIADRQQVGLALGEPGARGRGLALRTMPIATRVVGDPKIAAVVAAIDMAAERRGAAVLDRRHDLQLGEAQTPSVGEHGSWDRRPGRYRRPPARRSARRLSRRAPPGRAQICRACRADWSRRAPFASPPWCRRRCSPAWRGRAAPG